MKIHTPLHIFGIGLVCFCTMLTGCVRTQVGDFPPEERIALLKKGVQTKTQVARILGSPAAVTFFEPTSFIYVKAVQEKIAFLPHETVERKVLVISFDSSDKIQNIRSLSLKDGKKISFSGQYTPTAEKELNVIEQLLGNIGRFSNY